MQAFENARKLIERQPDGETAKILSAFVLDLESDGINPLSELYNLDHDEFALALELLAEWRLDRNYEQKATLVELCSQALETNAE